MVVLGAGAVEDVEQASSQLVRVVQRDEGIVAAMGPRLLTEAELLEAFRPDDTARELLESAVSRGAAVRWGGASGVVAVGVGLGAFIALSVGATAVVPLLVTGGVALALGVVLTITAGILGWQESRARLHGIFAWNRSVWERRWGSGSSMLAEARSRWVGPCPENESSTFCLGTTPVESDEQMLAAMEASAPAAALAFRDAASRALTGVVLSGIGLGLLVGSFVPILAIGTLPALVVGVVMLCVSAATSFLGWFGLDRAGRDMFDAIAAYDDAVLHAAAKAAREHDERASEPPAEAPPAAAPPAEPAEPSSPPPPPSARQPLRPQTSLDGPLVF